MRGLYDTEVLVGRTTNNSYRVEWHGGHPNRNPNQTADASIELFRNGGWCVTENGVARSGQRVLPFPHDGFGQDDEWVAANFTNATEILAVGYPQWVEQQVGEGLTNGLYKLTVSLADDPPETTNVVENGVERTLVVNPCGVGVGRDAYFSIEVNHSEYPDSKIVWSQGTNDVGTVEFMEPNFCTGRTVIQKLLMHGHADAALLDARDMTIGDVHGVYIIRGEE